MGFLLGDVYPSEIEKVDKTYSIVGTESMIIKSSVNITMQSVTVFSNIFHVCFNKNIPKSCKCHDRKFIYGADRKTIISSKILKFHYGADCKCNKCKCNILRIVIFYE